MEGGMYSGRQVQWEACTVGGTYSGQAAHIGQAAGG